MNQLVLTLRLHHLRTAAATSRVAVAKTRERTERASSTARVCSCDRTRPVWIHKKLYGSKPVAHNTVQHKPVGESTGVTQRYSYSLWSYCGAIASYYWRWRG